MRPVERGEIPEENGVPRQFREYRDARIPLIERMGGYCSYCEIALPSGPHIEHVRPKDPNPELETTWSNFLLACSNCNSTKRAKNVVLADYFWPDRDNTMRPFEYDSERAPKHAGWLTPSQQDVANRTLRLTGLDREPGHPDLSDSDFRWLKRQEAWQIARLERLKIERNGTPDQRDSAVQVAVGRGFFSVWMQVFYDDEDMRKRLIGWFQAATDCFGQRTDLIPRAGGLM